MSKEFKLTIIRDDLRGNNRKKKGFKLKFVRDGSSERTSRHGEKTNYCVIFV